MTNRIVHVGDVHLQHANPRNVDRLAGLDQVIAEQAAAPGLALWAIPGDLFHAKSTIEDRNALAARLQRMAAVAPVVMVRGNHDAPGDLEIFAKLKAAWPVVVLTRPGVISVSLPTGDTAAIAGLPYPDKHGVVAAGVAKDAVAATTTELLDVICMQLAHELEVARVSGAIPIALGHVNVRGSIASTGQPQIGREPEIDRASLDRLPVVYCALSHIHKAQEVGRGVYAGSVAAMDHGETEPKSYVVVDADRQPDGSWTASWQRQPLATPPMFHVAGELTRDGFFLDQDAPLCPVCDGNGSDRDALEWTTVAPPCPSCDGDGRRHIWEGCDVRVRYRFLASQRAVLDHARVREIFSTAFRLKVEPVAVPDRDVRAPEVAAARTLTDKIAAFQKVEQLAPSLAVKVAALEHQDPTQILADVDAFIAGLEAAAEAAVAA